ncbi:MmgE/PrpD family protein [Pseudodesulfovibrio tunisiensis]|uniref:MmgE/PrpD family protein n=1 Tax=Pseudodesulfovibrio tunisiensis TaxID=463192 RepID=UPI001FB29200|nr:MmgE/PrpD family protein [Pseudodesulfovibrio tunisiensis]
MTYAQQLARFITELSVEDLSEATRLKTSHCLIDYMAAVWNAQGHELARTYTTLARTLAGTGEAAPGTAPSGMATVIGQGRDLPVFWAAFANAAQGHVTEVDDGHRQSIMHIGTVVIPVALALAQSRGLDGRAIVESVICGYELAIRAGECFGPEHYAVFHTTATAGTFGAAAAAAKALGLDAERTAWALGHAGTQAAGLWEFLRDKAVDAKPLHPAKAAQNGLLAALLAEAGIRNASAIFEGRQGFCAATSKNPQYHYLTDGLGERYKVDEANFKGYPTCGQTHSMLDALTRIMREHHITAKDVASVEALVYDRAVDVAGITDPATLEQAKFSNPFCMAFLLTHGSLTFENMVPECVHDPEVRELMARVTLTRDEEMNAGFPAARPCRVKVTLKSGEILSADNRFRRGDPENPMNTDDMLDKFAQLTRKVLDDDQRKAVTDWCLNVPNEQAVAPEILTLSK